MGSVRWCRIAMLTFLGGSARFALTFLVGHSHVISFCFAHTSFFADHLAAERSSTPRADRGSGHRQGRERHQRQPQGKQVCGVAWFFVSDHNVSLLLCLVVPMICGRRLIGSWNHCTAHGAPLLVLLEGKRPYVSPESVYSWGPLQTSPALIALKHTVLHGFGLRDHTGTLSPYGLRHKCERPTRAYGILDDGQYNNRVVHMSCSSIARGWCVYLELPWVIGAAGR